MKSIYARESVCMQLRCRGELISPLAVLQDGRAVAWQGVRDLDGHAVAWQGVQDLEGINKR